MKNKLAFLKNIWILNFFRRVVYASSYYNEKYYGIMKWGFKSKEDTNYTYDLTPGNVLYMAHAISIATGVDYKKVMEYYKEVEINKGRGNIN